MEAWNKKKECYVEIVWQGKYLELNKDRDDRFLDKGPVLEDAKAMYTKENQMCSCCCMTVCECVPL